MNTDTQIRPNNLNRSLNKNVMTNFPKNRLRRLRQIHELNIINTETILSIEDLIAPIFVRPGENTSTPIKSMPGIYQFSIDLLCEEIENLKTLGIKAILLFGTLTEKDSTCLLYTSDAADE